MKTIIIKIKKGKISKQDLHIAAEALRNGEPVIFPTDTVYGIGVSAVHYEGIKKIYRIKKRAQKKPLVWLIDSPDRMKNLVSDISPAAQKLMAEFWPGALTLIFKASWVAGLSELYHGTLGLRIPHYPLVKQLVAAAGVPLATTSANKSGGISASSSADLRYFINKVRFIIDAGKLRESKESTVIDVTGTLPLILRDGAITRENITHVLSL